MAVPRCEHCHSISIIYNNLSVSSDLAYYLNPAYHSTVQCLQLSIPGSF